MTSTTQDGPSMKTGTVSDADRLEVNATTPCYLLNIAAELRNGIYELAFTADEAQVDLLNSKPPSPALLQCCKKISEEATGIFKAYVRDYYETKRFRLALKQDEEPLIKVDQVASRFDLQSMRQLRLEFDYKFLKAYKTMVLELEANKLLWSYPNPGLGRPYHIIFIKQKSGFDVAHNVTGQSEADRDVNRVRMMQSRDEEDVVFTRVKDQVKSYCRVMMRTYRHE